MKRLLIAFSAVALTAADRPPSQEPAASSGAATSLRAEDLRVAAIAYRLGLAGAEHCPVAYPLTGLLLHHLPEYDSADRRRMIAAYAIDRGPGVLAVVAGSPAAEAGLRAGDVLLSVNGTAFPSPLAMAELDRRKQWRAEIERSEALLEAELRKGPVELGVLRDGAKIRIGLSYRLGCPARIRLARSDQTNAFANGHYVIATTALLDFIRSDDELAIVIGHELAHNILRHPARLDAQGVPERGLLRGFGKNAARVRVTEEEADRLGLRLAWAAGYDVRAAIPFWRRYYAAFDRLPQLFRTHPGLEARERLIVETMGELPAPRHGDQTLVRSDQSSGKARLDSVD